MQTYIFVKMYGANKNIVLIVAITCICSSFSKYWF